MSAFNKIFGGYIQSQTKFLRERETAPDGSGISKKDTTMNDETKHDLPAVVDGDGFDDADTNDRLIQGTIVKCVDGNWSAKDDTALPPGMQLIALATAQAIQRWKDSRPIETIIKQPGHALPDIDKLNATIPEDEWEDGLDGEPRAPYVRQHIVYLLYPRDASVYTFINSTAGARIAVDGLKDKVKMMRILRGDKVVPVVELSAKPMKTQFGTKMRPDFKIVEWRELGDLQTPVTVPAIEHVGKSVKPVTTKEALRDEIPFDDDLSDLLDVR